MEIQRAGIEVAQHDAVEHEGLIVLLEQHARALAASAPG
jgi:hypothetical protein